MTNGISQELKFWQSLAFGLQETNGKRGGLGGNCGWGRRRIPLFNTKKPCPLNPYVFLLQMLPFLK